MEDRGGSAVGYRQTGMALAQHLRLRPWQAEPDGSFSKEAGRLYFQGAPEWIACQ